MMAIGQKWHQHKSFVCTIQGSHKGKSRENYYINDVEEYMMRDYGTVLKISSPL